jgi:hypothetical protein
MDLKLQQIPMVLYLYGDRKNKSSRCPRAVRRRRVVGNHRVPGLAADEFLPVVLSADWDSILFGK